MEQILKDAEFCLKSEDKDDMSLRNRAICAIMDMDIKDVEKYLSWIETGKI